MESTTFAKIWSFLMLSVNAVIMICVRNCRISFTLIVLFPLLLLFVDRRIHSDLVCVILPARTSISTSKELTATTAA
jgi:hypothetical protein